MHIHRWLLQRKNVLEKTTKEGESPVILKGHDAPVCMMTSSKTRNGKTCLNIGAPPSKSEYFSMTNSLCLGPLDECSPDSGAQPGGGCSHQVREQNPVNSL